MGEGGWVGGGSQFGESAAIGKLLFLSWKTVERRPENRYFVCENR